MPFVCNFSFWRPCLGPAADSFLNQPAVRVVFASPKVRYAHGALVCCFATFSSTKSKQKKGDPAVCDPCGANLRRGVCGVRRGTRYALARCARTTTASQITKHAREGAHATPQTPRRRRSQKGVGSPTAQQPNSHTGRCCARPRWAQALCAAQRQAERSDGPKGCSVAGSLQDAPRSAAVSGSGLAIV